MALSGRDDINNHTDFKNVIKNIGKTYLTPDPIDEIFISTAYYEIIKASPKSFIPGLDDFFWLQHHYGCKPFPTQIIFKSEDRINLDN